ncbi:coproporphyrinogen III oxidase [Gloeomargarita lithophora Alchichica-D10]|uniref:Heme chaperone HemW n=1 Tax=Gloeomargarita lithophora Alchichica-D10 TaxID=1188229 RepID=A0A1J0AFJ9_9CYAN|nr:radical SAM family heme chaperone HemW [Gloeomargarita lithophora]APB34718.1 coproporphyrinogen III oxidase [Gloeomargarita lithophora Alchichica-D10]
MLGYLFNKRTRSGSAPKAAYVHIPFCQQKCHYCDFPVIVDNKPNSRRRSQYLETLRWEIKLTSSRQQPLTSVFFGGGTPSLLTPAELGQILQDLQQQFGCAEDVEISLEADPGTLGIHHLKEYQNLGVNRLSLGVQSFIPELLQISGRTHTVQDIETAILKIKECGWENWSLDLIQGLPGQTLDQWQFSLQKAIEAQPKHISVYDLTLEPKTRFYRDYPEDSPQLPGDELTAKMYCFAHEFLESHGFIHYEISNYAQPGYPCRHNLTYWQNQPYYGFGLGATSYVDQVRFQRPKTIKAYREWVEQQAVFGDVEMLDYPLEEKDELLEGLMLGLRLKEGINLTQLLKPFKGGIKDSLQSIIVNQLSRFQPEGWVGNQRNQWFLIPPQGFLMSNTVLQHIWLALDDITIL